MNEKRQKFIGALGIDVDRRTLTGFVNVEGNERLWETSINPSGCGVRQPKTGQTHSISQSACIWESEFYVKLIVHDWLHLLSHRR